MPRPEENGLPLEAVGLLDKLGRRQPLHFRLTWRGSKIPRGARIGGIAIGWAQHGILTGAGGEELGYYDRIAEFTGPDRDQHEMLIHCAAPATDPSGAACPGA